MKNIVVLAFRFLVESGMVNDRTHVPKANLHLLPKADSSRKLLLVWFVPSMLLFDNLVGAGEESGRHSKAECLGGLQVDNQFYVRGLNDWQISW
jgi:hypothetical protein